MANGIVGNSWIISLKLSMYNLDYSTFMVLWYLLISILNKAGASWFLSLPKIESKANICWIKTKLSDFFEIVTDWMYSINFEPFYGSESKSVLSALIVRSKFSELTVL